MWRLSDLSANPDFRGQRSYLGLAFLGLHFWQPRVLALDEETSHLDLANEQRVAHALAQMQLTRILIAHRPETIAHAQRVVQVRRGLVVEGGVGD